MENSGRQNVSIKLLPHSETRSFSRHFFAQNIILLVNDRKSQTAMKKGDRVAYMVVEKEFLL